MMKIQWCKAKASKTRAVRRAQIIPALQSVWKIIPAQLSLFLSSLVILSAEL